MKEILTALMIWLGANTPFNTNHDVPNVLFLTQDQMEKLFYKEGNKIPSTLHGLYDKDSDPLYCQILGIGENHGIWEYCYTRWYTTYKTKTICNSNVQRRWKKMPGLYKNSI
jgi:hypothetical protein